MQITKFRSLINSTVTKNFLRTVATENGVENIQEARPFKEIPGPSALPIIGQMLHFLPGGQFHDISKIQEKMYNAFGPIVRLDPFMGRKEAMVLLFDPESCAQVLRSENWMPIRPGFHSLEYYRKYHNKTKEQSRKHTGLITDHGDRWKDVRTMVNPVMLQPKTIRLYATALEEVAEDMVARMRSIRDENNMLQKQFDVEMNLWALESIGVVALGGRLNCFDPNLAEDSPARQLIRCVHDLFKTSNELDFQGGLWRYISTPAFKKAMKLYEEQENLTKYFVKKAIKELEAEDKIKSEDEKGVLEKLLHINEEIAVVMACDMLSAGVDTAANTMIAIFYYMAMNPDKQTKLRHELTTKSTTESKKYLSACIREAMRLQPVTSGNIRQTTKEYNILGYRIPKDTYVVFNHQYMSSMESQYPRAREYIPERWIDKDSPLYYSKAHPFAYGPFGFGVRMCIGRRIAELEIETFVAKAVQNFEIGWHGPQVPLQIKQESLNYIKGPYNFIFNDIK